MSHPEAPVSSSTPRISVVTPSFNQAKYLERTIRSVLEQGYDNLEYFVMDGGSTDGSVEIIRRYEDRITQWVSGPDGGQAAAIRAGWERATGDVLAWLNSDDFYLPGAVEFAATQFAADPTLELLYGRCQLIDGNGASLGYVGRPFSRLIMLASHDVIPQPAAFMRASAVRAAGGVDPALRYAMDFDLFMRMAEQRQPGFARRTLAVATVHGAMKTLTGSAGMVAERQVIRRRHARGLERLIVNVQPVASSVYRHLPAGIQRALRIVRPRRIYDDPG